MRKRVSVLGIFIDSLDMGQAAAKVEELIANGRPGLIVTANAEMVMQAQEDAALAEILNGAQLVVPDGAGVVWAARHSGQDVPERVAGYDLAQRLFDLAARRGYRIFMLGAKPEVVAAARQKAEVLYPGVQIIGIRQGFFTHAEESGIVAEIKAARPDILLAALGVPKQEKWLAQYLHEINVPVCMGVGGTFDVMAGVMRRAPRWVQNLNLEWLYRLTQQPGRIIRMMALPRFVWKVLFFSKKC